MNICQIDNCDQPVIGRGWCREHYYRWRRNGDPLGGRASPGKPMQWLRDHAESDGDGCLIWPFRRGGAGYAYINNGPACRVMCELAHGPAPSSEHEVAHSCGNGTSGCIHPSHLRWATKIDNEHDKIAHGTRLCGPQLTWAKLTEADVLEIRRLQGSATQQRIADRFGVSRSLIGLIHQRQIWRHV